MKILNSNFFKLSRMNSVVLLKITSILLSIIAVPAYMLLFILLADKSTPVGIAALVILLLLFGIAMKIAVKYSKKNGKHYGFTVMLVFAIVGIVTCVIFRMYIVELVHEVLWPTGPGALPPSAIN